MCCSLLQVAFYVLLKASSEMENRKWIGSCGTEGKKMGQGRQRCQNWQLQPTSHEEVETGMDIGKSSVLTIGCRFGVTLGEAAHISQGKTKEMIYESTPRIWKDKSFYLKGTSSRHTTASIALHYIRVCKNVERPTTSFIIFSCRIFFNHSTYCHQALKRSFICLFMYYMLLSQNTSPKGLEFYQYKLLLYLYFLE